MFLVFQSYRDSAIGYMCKSLDHGICRTKFFLKTKPFWLLEREEVISTYRKTFVGYKILYYWFFTIFLFRNWTGVNEEVVRIGYHNLRLVQNFGDSRKITGRLPKCENHTGGFRRLEKKQRDSIELKRSV